MYLTDVLDTLIKVDKREIFTIPNIITYIRILLIPFTCICFLCGEYTVCFSLSIAFWLGDILDGYLARRLSQVTDLGKLLDPIVDKLFQFSFIFCASFLYDVIFVLVALQFVKEFILIFVAGYGMLKYSIHESAMWYGKLNTGILNTSIILILLFRGMTDWALFTIVVINSISLVLSFVLYLLRYLRLIKSARDSI